MHTRTALFEAYLDEYRSAAAPADAMRVVDALVPLINWDDGLYREEKLERWARILLAAASRL